MFEGTPILEVATVSRDESGSILFIDYWQRRW